MPLYNIKAKHLYPQLECIRRECMLELSNNFQGVYAPTRKFCTAALAASWSDSDFFKWNSNVFLSEVCQICQYELPPKAWGCVQQLQYWRRTSTSLNRVKIECRVLSFSFVPVESALPNHIGIMKSKNRLQQHWNLLWTALGNRRGFARGNSYSGNILLRASY